METGAQDVTVSLLSLAVLKSACMYSKSVTSTQLALAEQALGTKLIRHSIAEVQFYNDHFKSLTEFNDKGEAMGLHKDLRPNGLKPDELRYIQNERTICKLDFLYWATRYAYINDYEKNLVLFKPNKTQLAKLNLWAASEEKSHAIEELNLKARRLGISTLVELAVAHRVAFWVASTALVASSDPSKSRDMADIMRLVYDLMPWWLLPKKTTGRTGELYEFFELKSKIMVRWGNQDAGLGRGGTPNLTHLCLAPSTLIYTDRGIVPIKDAAGLVKTSRNRMQPIRAVVKSERAREATAEISLWGNYSPLSVTRDHPVLTPEGFRPAAEVKHKQYVRMPVRPIEQTLSMFEFSTRHTGRIRTSRTPKPVQPSEFPLDYDWGWLCGLYLAEGSVNQNNKLKVSDPFDKIIFTVHDKEVKRFSERLGRAWKGHLKKRSLHGLTSHLTIYNSGLSRWIARNFGRKIQKQIPDWAWMAGRQFCLGLLEGYLEGDGHIPANTNEIYASSISSSLIFQLRELVASLGFGWSAIYFRSAGVHYKRNCRDIWTLLLAGTTAQAARKYYEWPVHLATAAKHWRWANGKRDIDIQVKGNEVGFSEEFYDLEVDAPEHDFSTIHCCVKNSEMPDFDDPYEKIDGALLKAIIPTAKVLTQFESTAKGKGNWLHSNWEDAKANWPNSRLRPIFFPWFVGDDIYPHPDWLSLHPVPQQWEPLQITCDHAATAERFVHNWDLLRDILGAKWEMSKAQMWYWQFNREEAARKKTPEGRSMLTVFLEEMPGDDIEAFQTPHSNIFEPELIYEIKAKFSDPQVFEVRGSEDEIPHFQHYFPSDYAEIPPTVLRPHWTDALPAAEYTLIPLRFQGYSNLSAIGKLIVWEWPQDDTEYGLGVDPSYGKGKDLSAIEVIRNRTMDRCEAQVAEFVSPLLDSHLLWPYVIAIADFYSTLRNGTRSQARVAIELAANGQEVQRELRDRGWWNFHQRVPEDAKTVDYSREYRMGFETTRKSRPKVTQGLERAIRDKSCVVNSPWLLEECGGLIWNAEKERLEAGYGSHDDRYMALGIIRESFRQTETPAMRVNAHQQKVEREQRANYHPVFTRPDMVRDVPSAWYEEHEAEIERGLLR